jgi:hypothetical protein
MEYTVYNTSTGLIHSHGSSQGLTDLSQILVNEEDSIIEGYVDRRIYKIIDGVPTEYTPDVMPILRNKRDGLLADSDWTQMADSPLSSSKKTEWATYRQALRDLPATNTATIEADVIWPTEPS